MEKTPRNLSSSQISKQSTISRRSSTKQSESSKMLKSEIYEKYNINKDIIKEINDDENKFKILLEQIYFKKKKELKELTQTPYSLLKQ
jgi:hypothetical protein